MAEFDASSRYRLVATADQNPGYDLLTRSTKGPFVDTGLTLNKFDNAFAEANAARVYLSVETLREMAEGAGLFDSLRAELVDAEDRGFTRGHAAAEKENIRGAVLDLYDRLGSVLERLAGPESAPAVEGAAGFDDEEPLIPVTDGPAAREQPEDSTAGTDEAARDTGEAGRQGDGTRGNRRPNRLSAGTGDGNPFRI